MEATCPNLNISQLDIIAISEPVVVIAGLAGSDSGDSTHHTAALEKQRSQGTSGILCHVGHGKLKNLASSLQTLPSFKARPRVSWMVETSRLGQPYARHVGATHGRGKRQRSIQCLMSGRSGTSKIRDLNVVLLKDER